MTRQRIVSPRLEALLVAGAALVVSFGFGWCTWVLGERLLHHLDVRSWDVRSCVVEARRMVEYDQTPFPPFHNTRRTFAYDLRDVDTGRLYPGSYLSPSVPRYGVDEEWLFRHAPYTTADCRIEPEGERAYLYAEGFGYIALVAVGCVFFGGLSGGALLTGVLYGARASGLVE